MKPFTQAQINHICYQIDMWYMKWGNHIIIDDRKNYIAAKYELWKDICQFDSKSQPKEWIENVEGKAISGSEAK
jgi:hypothetical protein